MDRFFIFSCLKYQKSIYIILFFCVFTLFSNKTQSQSIQTDLDLIGTQKTKLVKNKKKRKLIQKINPIYWTFQGSLGFYQKVVSPQFSADCLYELSCSRFSREAIKEFGVIKGISLTADRLTRCNRNTLFSFYQKKMNSKGKIIDIPLDYKINK